MMIEIFDRNAAVEQREQRLPVDRDGGVERGHLVARLDVNALQQRDVALGTGAQHRIDRCRDAQLQQRADSVGIAVEDIEMRHGSASVAMRAL